MAETKSSGNRAAPVCIDGEIVVQAQETYPGAYIGTAQQLIDEGLIPEGTKWPERTQRRNWKSGKLSFMLERRRPEGHKGPWVHLDHWRVLIFCHRNNGWEDHLYREYLGKHRYHRARTQTWEPFLESQKDIAFQAFKTKIPGFAS